MATTTPKTPTMTKAEREKAQALYDLSQLASDYAEMRAKKDEYEAGMSNLSAQMQALCIVHDITKERVGDYNLTLVQGSSRTLQATRLLELGVAPDILNAAYTIRPTQYISIKLAKDEGDR